mgnify:CR=1 FL=1
MITVNFKLLRIAGFNIKHFITQNKVVRLNSPDWYSLYFKIFHTFWGNLWNNREIFLLCSIWRNLSRCTIFPGVVFELFWIISAPWTKIFFLLLIDYPFAYLYLLHRHLQCIPPNSNVVVSKFISFNVLIKPACPTETTGNPW